MVSEYNGVPIDPPQNTKHYLVASEIDIVANFQLYHDEDNLQFEQMMMTALDYYSVSSLKQQSAGTHVTLL